MMDNTWAWAYSRFALKLAHPKLMSIPSYVYAHFVYERICGPKFLEDFLFFSSDPRACCVWKNWQEIWGNVISSLHNIPVPYIVFNEEPERNFGCANINPDGCNAYPL
jgi:hypothetical protein